MVLEYVTSAFKLEKSNVYVWSDGCASQFRSRYTFYLMTMYDPMYDITWYYNERHHGKGPMDGIGGTIKNIVFRHVKSGKCVIDTPKQFAEYAAGEIKGVTCLYMPERKLVSEPEEIEQAPKIEQTLQIHKIGRSYNEFGVCYLEFFYIASDEEPFHVQFYRKEDQPLVCGHPEIEYKDDNLCSRCVRKYVTNDTQDWLECPVCKLWFHERCFDL